MNTANLDWPVPLAASSEPMQCVAYDLREDAFRQGSKAKRSTASSALNVEYTAAHLGEDEVLRRHLARILATLALVVLLAGIFWLVRGLAMAGPGNDEREISALDVWLGEHLAVPPILFGVLLGIVVGGYARRPVRTGAAIIGLFAFMIVLLVVAMIGVASQAGGDGFVLFGALAIAIGAVVTLVLVLPSFLIALAAMKAMTDVDPAQPDQPG